MKSRFRILPVALLVLVIPATVVARPLDGRSQDTITRLSVVKFRIGVLISAQNQAATQAVVPVVNTGLQRTGSITGQVVLPSGQQVANRIRITLSGYRISSLIGYTDNKGRFLFPGIGDGTYTLEVEGDPNLYEPVTQEVRVTYGAHPVLVITLREKRQAVSKSNSNVVFAGELDQQVPDEARKEFEKGAELSDKGKFRDAVKCFKNAVTIFPTYLMARNYLGVQYLKLGQWHDAAEQFEVAIEINSKALNPRQNLAIALIEQKKYAQAIEHLNHALAIDSSSAAAHLYAGIASLGVEAIDQAERELSLALSLGGSEYANAHFYLALAHIKKGEREPAKRELMAYLEKVPKGEKVPRARELLEKLR